VAAFAASVFATSTSADILATAKANVVGDKFIVYDGFKYGGNIPVGADKNPDGMRLLVKSANAMGMLRDNRQITYLYLGDTALAMRVDADGTWNGQKSHVVLDWDYGVPVVRLDVASPDGKTRQISVAADNLAWDEKTPGVYGGAAKTTPQERLIIGYLMPSEVVLEARDGANLIKASKDGVKDVLTVPIPKLGAGVNMVATLDSEGHPIHSSIAYNGHTYTGDFENFIQDRMDMDANFSHHVVLKVDGKEMANLDVNWHQVNPYLIFPVPKEVAAK